MSNDALETEGASGQAENFNLRIANALKGLLEHRAAEKGLSLNKEIMAICNLWLEHSDFQSKSPASAFSIKVGM